MAFSIGEAAARTGLTASAIRYYEREGLVPRAARASGRRVYDSGLIERLRIIARARKAGFGIGEIRALMGQLRGGSPSTAWQSFAATKIAELDEQIESARLLREAMKESMRCGCLKLVDCTVLGR